MPRIFWVVNHAMYMDLRESPPLVDVLVRDRRSPHRLREQRNTCNTMALSVVRPSWTGSKGRLIIISTEYPRTLR